MSAAKKKVPKPGPQRAAEYIPYRRRPRMLIAALHHLVETGHRLVIHWDDRCPDRRWETPVFDALAAAERALEAIEAYTAPGPPKALEKATVQP